MYEKMRAERQRLEWEIASLKAKIAELPEGKLVCVRGGRYTKWYRSDGHKSVYIPKKQKELAERLAAKKYLQARLEELLQEQKAIDFYLRHHHSNLSCAEQLLSEDSLYSELLSPYFTPEAQELKNWMSEPFESNPSYPEQCIHRTSAGILVRSKSEALIAMLLHTSKIPFRYECALPLGDVIVYPDFTIRHPRTGQLFYWEHFGMMDNPAYIKNAFSKLQLYTEHGIVPSIQLLTTYETKEHPLDFAAAENLVKLYFL